ncbi:Rho GTPase-activating protein 27 CIN85-associated multi-domain-containing [Channa argus]|uniref:Rho GTPase-activating protein 27 CIN85-associated multi-domain-containing n=1 Tax=Channa argus TaxID=215402 RepID=A0A6G1QPG4_CHAAH|nr:Rho GTPase-activating protein 27 CIN85-associated multi-domain-containing [Channa argus]
MELVSVQYEFEYKARDGRLVSIKPNESYILVSKTNDHWWHVRKDQDTMPFYVPAQYVKEVTSHAGDPPNTNKLDLIECVTTTKPVDTANGAPRKAVIRVAAHDASRETHRFSTFGLCDDPPDTKPTETVKGGQTTTSFAPTSNNPKNTKAEDSSGSFSFTSAPLKTDSLQLYSQPHYARKPRKGQEQSKSSRNVKVEQPQAFADDGDMDFPLPPDLPIYDTIPELNIPDSYTFPAPVSPSDMSASWPLARLEQSAEATSSANTLSIERAQNENIRSAVYVNVAQLRQSISESPPSAPSSYSPSYLDQEGWEVHVDQQSGQQYYYHPATGRTTWENPFLDSPTDPEPLPLEVPCSPSPPQSRACSLYATSPSAYTSDWEQLVDEDSGRPYFYNSMSGETSWEPPEQLSPYPPLMEPMSVQRFQYDGPPPLPEEDYPSGDYAGPDQPEAYAEIHASGPPTIRKEYALSHGNRGIIPRANLDRGTQTGWNLSVEPNGTYVFTSEHSSDEWIKSVDDQGQTYYYLRDGSKSQWNLPEAPVAPGQSRVENGEAENVSVIKNWRHTMGPSQFSSAQDEGVQNLEKAGILNKTKVSENGKKVRKNWTQAWTVLYGGVVTFHKDPKSAVTGTSVRQYKTNPEVKVELRGATIGWASKDKSSKKNVLELKGKNGVEFLIQSDTESIIHDWHKVLVDTIRQLEYQNHQSEEEDGDLYEKIPNIERDDKSSSIDKRRPSRPVTQSSGSIGDTDQKKVRTKLMKFLMKRPTLQSVKEKGYIRENVFGCHLTTLCAQERTTVPSFVEKCIKAVERRGLDIDGLYRVSGNLAVIQKLRYKADHEELDLEDGQWEDVHVITGALKLFFRELPEPLFPYSHFNDFVTAIRIADYNTKLSCMCDLVESLPPANHDTMKLLFGHLRRVIKCGEDNRMTVQNVAIVFGPTLLRPEMESANIAMHMVFQNQIVEFILNEYEYFFHC